jgi:general stress protein YciG
MNAAVVELGMPKRSSYKDPNLSAFSIMQQVTTDGTRAPFSEVSAALDNSALRRQLMQEMGRRGGLKGGKARADRLSKEQLSESGKKAAAARWASKKLTPKP